MTLAGHQPEYLPYLGFFCKMQRCDQFVLVDHVQYLKKSFQNRNYIRTRTEKLLLTTPVLSKADPSQKLSEVLINNKSPWAKKHWKSICLNYHSSPFFKDHKDFFEAVYAARWERLVDLNVAIIVYLMSCFAIDKHLVRSSEYDIIGRKTDMLVDLCDKLGADTYVSGWGAKAYVDVDTFREHNLKHRFVKFVYPIYRQVSKPFIENLSAIDLLFNNGPAAKEILSEAVRQCVVEET